MDETQPSMVSAAFDDIAVPDFADVVLVPIPPGPAQLPTDPAVWARAVFDVRAAPRLMLLLFALRQALVRVIGVEPAEPDIFTVAAVRGGEALIRADDDHLDFRAAVAADLEQRLLRVTTVVRLHGWRGRLYFAPVSVLHGPITRAMASAAAARLAQGA